MPSRMTFFKFAFLLYFSLGIFCSFLFFQVEAKEQKTDWKMFGLGIFLTVFLTDSFNLFRWKTKSSNKEMYGSLKHQLLNLKCSSTWFNFGFWKKQLQSNNSNLDFVTACEDLGKLLITFSKFQDNESLLDVGYGCGDQMLLWLKELKPSSIIGITNEENQYFEAQKKLDALNFEDKKKVELFCGDAITTLANLLSKQPFQVDHIFVLDAIYHFNTRSKFLCQSRNILKVGGRITFTDVALTTCWNSYPPFIKLFLRLFARIVQIPFQNLICLSDYELHLKEVGFQDIEIECIEQDVWGGFILFLDQHSKYFKEILPNSTWRPYHFIRWLLQYILKNFILHYVIITARKKDK